MAIPRGWAGWAVAHPESLRFTLPTKSRLDSYHKLPNSVPTSEQSAQPESTTRMSTTRMLISSWGEGRCVFPLGLLPSGTTPGAFQTLADPTLLLPSPSGCHRRVMSWRHRSGGVVATRFRWPRSRPCGLHLGLGGLGCPHKCCPLEWMWW
jgi:hypothetical protein